MRKIVYGSLFLALVGIGVVGCKKDDNRNRIISTQYDGVTTDGKMLIFESVEDYERIMNDLTEEKEILFSNKLSSLAYNNYFSVERLEAKSDDESAQEMDEFFGKLLNEDGAIQIGGHVFKIDLETEQVFVILKDNVENDYADLISGNTTNTNVSVYTVDQEVLYLVNGEIEEKCGGIGGYFDKTTVYFENNTIEGDFRVRHFRAGVYYRLKAKASYKSSEICYMTIRTKNSREWWRRRPCNSGHTTSRALGTVKDNTDNGEKSITYTSYLGTRNLNGMNFFAEATFYKAGSAISSTSIILGRNVNSPY